MIPAGDRSSPVRTILWSSWSTAGKGLKGGYSFVTPNAAEDLPRLAAVEKELPTVRERLRLDYRVYRMVEEP